MKNLEPKFKLGDTVRVQDGRISRLGRVVGIYPNPWVKGFPEYIIEILGSKNSCFASECVLDYISVFEEIKEHLKKKETK